jgi:hypothetical protein
MTTRGDVFCAFFLLTAYATVQHYFTVNTSLMFMGGTWSYKEDSSGVGVVLTPDDPDSSACRKFKYKNLKHYPSLLDGSYADATEFTLAKNDVFELLRLERQMSANMYVCISALLAMTLYLLHHERHHHALMVSGWSMLPLPVVYFMRIYNVELPLAHELCKMMLYNTDGTQYFGYDPLNDFLQNITLEGVGFSNYMNRLPHSNGSNSVGYMFGMVACPLLFAIGLYLLIKPIMQPTMIRDWDYSSNFYKVVRGFPLCIALELLLSALSYLAMGSASLLQRGFNYVHEAGCIKNHSLFSGDNINYGAINSSFNTDTHTRERVAFDV